jgi:hypothetical protein
MAVELVEREEGGPARERGGKGDHASLAARERPGGPIEQPHGSRRFRRLAGTAARIGRREPGKTAARGELVLDAGEEAGSS